MNNHQRRFGLTVLLSVLALALLAQVNSQGQQFTTAQAQEATPTVSDELTVALERARTPVTANDQWTPFAQDFDGVTMMLVPAGCFMMGSTQAQVDEQLSIGMNRDLAESQLPQHEQCWDEPFWIDQTEVTNAQYQRFIDAGGYTNRAYWTEIGWSWREVNNTTQPVCWTDNRYNGADQPVVCVPWYEAFAYANWRAEETGLPVRLPTEAEREYAARGPDALLYPWGNDFVAANAITSETNPRPQAAAAVGSRPDGASWVGAFDLSGNVWEWMSSNCDRSYPYAADDGREDAAGSSNRCLRGGSWSGDQVLARALFRNWFYPHSWSPDRGFRLVLSSAG